MNEIGVPLSLRTVSKSIECKKAAAISADVNVYALLTHRRVKFCNSIFHKFYSAYAVLLITIFVHLCSYARILVGRETGIRL